MSDCYFEYQVATNSVYRSTQFYISLTSLITLIIMIGWLGKRLYTSVFHGNLKFLLFTFFGLLFIFTILELIMATYQAIYPFFIKNYCDLIISQTSYMSLHLFLLTLLATNIFFPTVISIERFVAMSNPDTYEYTNVVLGPILMVATILLNCVLVFITYEDETFTEKSISYTYIPSTSAYNMNLFYLFLLIVNVPNFAISLFINRTNLRLKKRLHLDASLTRKYAVEEIITSTKFTFAINITHLCFFGTYLIVICFMRLVGSVLIEDKVLYQSMRGAVLALVPTVNLAITTVSTWMLKSFTVIRSKKIETTVKIRYNGKEGAKNHDDAIFRVWNEMAKK